MPTVPGNTRVVYAAKQTAKGAAASTPTHKFTLSGDAALNPGRSIIQLPETDASMQAPNSVVVGSRPVGGWQGWVRYSEFAWLMHMLLGNNVDSGAGPYIHTATPVQNIPYITFWDVVPGSMCTKYVDGRMGSVAISSEALAGIQYTVEAVAQSVELNATEPVAPAGSATDGALSYPHVQIRVGGVHLGTHDAFSLTINRNVTILGGDLGLASYDSSVGIFVVEGTLRRIYDSDAAYNEFHGGSAAATVLTTAIYSEAFQLKFEQTSPAHSITFDSDDIEYTDTTIPVNVDGTPIIMERSFRTQRQVAVADNMTVVTTNALATSVTSPT